MEAIAPPPLPARLPAAPPRLLSVLHYVMAGFTALFSVFPVIYLVLGIAVLSGAMSMDGSTASSPGEVQLMGWTPPPSTP